MVKRVFIVECPGLAFPVQAQSDARLPPLQSMTCRSKKARVTISCTGKGRPGSCGEIGSTPPKWSMHARFSA